jgi:serine protease inhibitor
MAEVTFNRPFFYVIREVESGTILFMGTFAGEKL